VTLGNHRHYVMILTDVGSGIGFVSVAIAQLHQNLKFVFQDLPSTIAAAAEQMPADLKERITFQGYDFLTSNPVRFIFHNWSDPYCIRILQALIPALKPGAVVYHPSDCYRRLCFSG
jgi:hypothetical protein